MATIDKHQHVPHVPDPSVPYLYHGITSMEADPYNRRVLPSWEELREIVLVPAALREKESWHNFHQIDALAGDDRYLFARPVMTAGWPLKQDTICLAWASHEAGVEAGRVYDALTSYQFIASGLLDDDEQRVEGDEATVALVTHALRSWVKLVTLNHYETQKLIGALQQLEASFVRKVLQEADASYPAILSRQFFTGAYEDLLSLMGLVDLFKATMQARAQQSDFNTVYDELATVRDPTLGELPSYSGSPSDYLLNNYWHAWTLPKSDQPPEQWKRFDERKLGNCEVLLVGEYPISEAAWVWIPDVGRWLSPRELDATGRRANRQAHRRQVQYASPLAGVPLTVL